MHLDLPRWKELPDMDLYLEQVLSLLDVRLSGQLSGKRKQVLTRTMINNPPKSGSPVRLVRIA